MSAAFSHISTSAMQLYSQLLHSRQQLPNEEIFASIISSWQDQEGVLPAHLGLSKDAFQNLIHRYFPHFNVEELKYIDRTFDSNRFPEIEELKQLLQNYRDTSVLGSEEMVEIVAMGCLGNDHLWQDLGLWSRPQLSALMKTNFSNLAARNIKDMKWKKFLYKQLCETEGVYVCRAPSCDICTDYTKCFSPED
jgi:nitrogen fixation protein NifQ